MKYITINKERHYVTLRDTKDWNFVCLRGHRHKFIALSPTDHRSSYDYLICSKCGCSCGLNQIDFIGYLKRRKMSLDKFTSEIEYKLLYPSREVAKTKKRSK